MPTLPTPHAIRAQNRESPALGATRRDPPRRSAHATVVEGGVAGVPCQGTGVAMVDDHRASVRQSMRACVSVNAVPIRGRYVLLQEDLVPRVKRAKSRQLSCSKTDKEGRTALDAHLEQIYARTCTLSGVVHVRLLILFNATEPLAHKPYQSWPQPRG